MALTLLYCDGYDAILTMSETSWDTFGTDCAIDLTGTLSRTGLGCLVIQSSSVGPSKRPPKLLNNQQTNLLMTDAFNPQLTPLLGFSGDIMQLIDSGSAIAQVRIVFNHDLSISVLNGNDPLPTLLGTSSPGVINPLAYNYISAKCFIDPAAGSVLVRVNGVIVLNLSGVVTSAAGSSGMADTLQLMTLGGPSYHDDTTLWLWTDPSDDMTGSPNIYTFLSSADSTPLQWTPSTGTDHYPLVNTVPPDPSQWVSAPGVEDVDQYIHSLPAPQNKPTFPATVQILGVQNDLVAEQVSGSIVINSQAGGLTASPDLPLTNSYKAYPFPFTINPVTSAPWSITDFPTTGIGPEILVVG